MSLRGDKSRPRAGDAVVTITCSPDTSIEDRMDLLSFAFVKTVSGKPLRRVVSWEPAEGFIRFIVGAGHIDRAPHGRLETHLQPWAS
jgi:hypothetical protein